MLFTSIAFMWFFPLVSALYLALPFRLRWVVLLAASYYFYASWDPRYLLLIMLTTGVNYTLSLAMVGAGPVRRRWCLTAAMLTSLGLLSAFKYYNFFAGSLGSLLHRSGVNASLPLLHVLLPVGISFFTLQTLGYTLDVYWGVREPERHAGLFALYVAFFPQLVAGPIERSRTLLPQFRERHGFDAGRIRSGLMLMLMGFFKKLVVADRLALYVNEVYGRPKDFLGGPTVLATYFFAFQIYCDFSGYSDIAIGAARVMGYRLMTNFRAPYFAASLQDFWRRWHISLSTWFRDYLYIPLGGNRVGRGRWTVNLMLVFVLSGVWHGAAWTFFVWGAIHGVWMLISRWSGEAWKAAGVAIGPFLRRAAAGLGVLITFHVVCMSWIPFRARSIGEAGYMIRHLFDTGRGRTAWYAAGFSQFYLSILFIALLIAMDLGIQSRAIRGWWERAPAWVRGAAAILLLYLIAGFGQFTARDFIYFRF